MSSKQTLAQLSAADPKNSVWVSASAGTGKTRVLVNRMLRLMLSGNKPEKLLCITFTKAAAAEVLQRIQESVVEWSYLPTDQLTESIQGLLERTPHKDEIKRARKLLPMILQSPGGMRIVTIHAFCQSVLARFPLEAGVPPGFAICDDSQSHLLLRQAKHILLDKTTFNTDPFLFQSLTHFFENVGEKDQNGLILEALNKRYRLRPLIEQYGIDYKAVQHALFSALNVSADDTVDSFTHRFIQSIDNTSLKNMSAALRTDTRATPRGTADLIDQFLHAQTIDVYQSIFLTQAGEPRNNTFKFLENMPSFVETALHDHAEQLNHFLAQRKQLALAHDSFALLHICLNILDIYQKLKHDQGMMDFEDQILKTIDLLNQPQGSAWVHYKLDGGIDHILVDEAQDTSPAQWDIIRKLTEEFFAGDAVKDHNTRTLFVVGDEKQSIFSFQNADPKAFSDSRAYFAQRSLESATSWQDIALSDNFRSASLILDFTDTVFKDAEYARHISHQDYTIKHQAFHTQYPAQIDIWPLLEPSDNAHQDTALVLANNIADEVAAMLRDKPITHSGRPLQPGDIMILVRKRHPMVAPLTKAFKDRNIPVTSSDRFVLNEHLAAQDCMVALQSCLNTNDDYSFACFLKSPFIGIDEAFLFELAQARGNRPLHEMFFAMGSPQVCNYINRLSEIIAYQSPGHAIHFLLTQPCPADTRSGRHAMITRLGYDCDDVLTILLNTAYEFEHEHHDGCQGFLTWLHNENRVIKREDGDADNTRVQIMTVHASKGLQAPIVFLADAHSKPQNYKRNMNLIWPDITDSFLWSANKENESILFEHEKDLFIQQQFSEYYRLLYVALTRAQQRLVICGHRMKRELFKDHSSWHDLCAKASHMIGTAYTFQDNESYLSLTQDGTLKPKDDVKHAVTDIGPIPHHLFAPVTAETQRARPLRPSQPPGVDVPTFSPLQNTQNNPYKRGQILHNLFYLVPNYPVAEQEAMLTQLIEYYIDDANEQQNIYNEVLSVLRHPEFAHLFTPQARAEVPIIGEVTIDGKPYALSGQIDRILVEDDRVLIVDFKTNRPAVLNAENVPEAYRFQMRAYRLLMEKIYPGRRIETALLWTSVPYLLPISG